MSPDEVLALARDVGALLEGHFLLTSGLHSAVYFQCARLLERPEVASRLGSALAAKLPAELRPAIGLAIAPALGGILVAHEVARALGIRALFAERDPATGALALRRGFSIARDEGAFVLEDVVTTGGSLRETMRVVEAAGGRVIATGALVLRGPRGPLDPDEGIPFHALVELDIPTYPPEACPLCLAGTPAVKPGSRLESPP